MKTKMFKDILTKEFLSKNLLNKSREKISEEVGCSIEMIHKMIRDYKLTGWFKQTIEQRFWSKVKKGKKILSSYCLEFTGALNKTGYGIHKNGNSNTTAHRWVYKKYIGNIPKNMLVCHRCDNPKCVKITHLFLGTHKDNMQDCVNKKRQVYGTKVHCTKLCEDDIRYIRKNFRMKTRKWSNISDLAKYFKVDNETIRNIINNKTWKHI